MDKQHKKKKGTNRKNGEKDKKDKEGDKESKMDVGMETIHAASKLQLANQVKVNIEPIFAKLGKTWLHPKLSQSLTSLRGNKGHPNASEPYGYRS